MPHVDRVADRPDPRSWGDDELMTLSEAARLHWPHGPITEHTLRTAVRDGRLAISQVAGKFFVTKRALADLSTCEPLEIGEMPDAVANGPHGFEDALGPMRGRQRR